MELDAHSRDVLATLPVGEARLIEQSALAPDADAATLELACLRLRNIAVRYEEGLKRARSSRRPGIGEEDPSTLSARLQLVCSALAACRARLDRGGGRERID
jgi:hypothetical protein